ncbi:hypothetical protein RND81_05G142900 [Saponaria officinalis]|uniref:Peptidase A1 domain-containing protein n=1 Tax=Saponaria officinalis TaxID=3572 RepID=A0AAW1L0Y2_SAPOF
MAFNYTYSCYVAILAITTMSFFHSSKASNPITLPIIKDSTKPQYYTTLQLGTPPTSVSLSIDLSSPWSWFACNVVGFNTTYYSGVPNSSTYRVLRCTNHKSCAIYDSNNCYNCNFPNCNPKGQMCLGEVYPPYLYTHGSSYGGHTLANLMVDIITVYKNNDTSSFKKRVFGFPFGCTGIDDLKGLSHYTKGVLSLARKGSNSLHSLISKVFKVPHKFALCLPSSYGPKINNGVMYFGGGPYKLSPSKINLSQHFVTTALVTNPVDVGETYEKRNSSIEYFVKLKSILIEGTPLKINSSMLLINKNGLGGTKINPIYPYTTLHTNIYNALTNAFTSKASAMNITRVARASSFSACFSSNNIVATKTGPKVPNIDLVLEGANGVWRIYGSNSMIKVSNNVRCLAFVDGGTTMKASIVIGGKQMEDNLVEFDLESSKLRTDVERHMQSN